MEKYEDCLPGEVLVMTSYGGKKMEDIVVGDKVMTRDGFRKVTEKLYCGRKRIVVLHFLFANGKSVDLAATEGQRVMTDFGWMPVAMLNERMSLVLRGEEDFVGINLLMQTDSYLDDVYDFVLSGEHEYYANDILIKSKQ